VIEKIVNSIFVEETGTVDVDGILGSGIMFRQNVTPGQFGLLVLGNRMTLLGQASPTHADNIENRAFVSQSQYGTKIKWTSVEAMYSKTFTAGLSQIKLQQSSTNVNGDDILVEVEGTIAIDPQDDNTMLFTVDQDSVPTNTINAVDAVINPQTFNPTGVANGTRYLLTESVGDDSTIIAGNGASAWGTLVASANDIVEKVDGEFVVDFNADFDDGSTQLQRGLQDSSSANGDSTRGVVQYVTNLTSSIQYKWLPTSNIWVKSYEGFYEPGTWTIVF
jgi:hypothetical protein